MATLNFPQDPMIGDLYEFASYTYKWDGEKWKTIGIRYNPVNDLRDELEPRISNNESKVFEALKRSYAAEGLNLVDGSFEEGGELLAASDVIITASGAGYSWGGTFPKTIPPLSSPETTGGIGVNAWRLCVIQNRGSYHDSVAEMISTVELTKEGFVIHTKMHNDKSKHGSASYVVMTLDDYGSTPDGEFITAQNRWVGSDYLLACGLVAKRIQHGKDIDPYEFGYIGIGVTYNGPTVAPTPDPTQDESPVLAKIGEYIKRGSPLDYGPSGSGTEFLQKGRYDINFPARSVCNISETVFDWPQYTNVYWNGTEVRPLSPIRAFNRRSNQVKMSQCAINFETFNTPEQIFTAAKAGQRATGIGYLFIPDGSPDPGYILDQFCTYEHIDVRGAWRGFDVSEYGIMFGDRFEKCNDYDSLEWGFRLYASSSRIATTNVFERCWKRALTRDAVQHAGKVYRALQHMAATSPVEPGVTAGWEDYWQVGKTSPTALETPTTQAAWVSGKFYRGMGKGYYLYNASTTVMHNCAMDGGSDVFAGDVLTTAGVTTHIDTFHLERHIKVKEESPSILAASGSISIGTLYSAETRVQTGSRSVVKWNGVRYECIKSHTAAANTEPKVGRQWRLYWKQVSTNVTGLTDWSLTTSYKSGNAVFVGGTNARRCRFDCVEEKGTVNYGGKLIYIDAKNFSSNAVITGEGIPGDAVINMAKQISLKGFVDPIVEPTLIYSTTSSGQWRPSLEDNGQLYAITIDSVVGAGCDVYIDGTMPRGTKFGFYVSNTASGVSNPSGPIRLVGENGAFFVGPTEIKNGAIWVQKIGTATDGTENSWRTWTEGASDMGLPQLAPDLTYPKSKTHAATLTRQITATIGTTPVTVLSVSGKCLLSCLYLSGLSTSGTLTVELVVDGVTIWNTSFANTYSQMNLLGGIDYSNLGDFNGYIVGSTLTLRLTQTASSSVTCNFLVRPIK